MTDGKKRNPNNSNMHVLFLDLKNTWQYHASYKESISFIELFTVYTQCHPCLENNKNVLLYVTRHSDKATKSQIYSQLWLQWSFYNNMLWLYLIFHTTKPLTILYTGKLYIGSFSGKAKEWGRKSQGFKAQRNILLIDRRMYRSIYRQKNRQDRWIRYDTRQPRYIL